MRLFQRELEMYGCSYAAIIFSSFKWALFATYPSSCKLYLSFEKVIFLQNTSSFDTINNYITLNFDGLKEAVIKMLSGGRTRVNTGRFKNDLSVINSRDAALTALIHLGYLGYDSERKNAYIPNYEIATAFQSAIEDGNWNEIAKTITQS